MLVAPRVQEYKLVGYAVPDDAEVFMNAACARVLFLLVLMPWQASGQQSESARLPLAITEKEAVDEWSRTI